MLLKVTDLNVYYGAIHALKGLSFEVGEGEIVSLIGANGAGKTTAMHTVSGLLRSRTGSVEFMDTNITKTEPHRIVKMGLAQVPRGGACSRACRCWKISRWARISALRPPKKV